MFKVIEFARMMVGTKAIATLSTAYLNALDYAKTRVQGADLTQMTDKTAPARDHHPPPGRAPLADDAEGLRRGHARADALHRLHPGRRRGRSRRAARTPRLDEHLNDLLLPIVKGYGSEKSYALIGQESLQVFGGSGYLQDYPLEQYVRDSKIDTLYEGTTAIQGMDLFFRKIVRDKGQALTKLLTDVQEFAKGEAGQRRARGRARPARARALEDVQGMVGAMVGQLTLGGRRRHATSTRSGRTPHGCSSPSVTSSCAWLLLRQAEVALKALDGAPSAATAPSTRARSRPRRSSPARCCRSSPASARSPRPPTTPSWTSPRTPSRTRPFHADLESARPAGRSASLKIARGAAPDLDGLRACRPARRGPRAPVVFVVVHGEADGGLAVRPQGGEGFVQQRGPEPSAAGATDRRQHGDDTSVGRHLADHGRAGPSASWARRPRSGRPPGPSRKCRTWSAVRTRSPWWSANASNTVDEVLEVPFDDDRRDDDTRWELGRPHGVDEAAHHREVRAQRAEAQSLERREPWVRRATAWMTA